MSAFVVREAVPADAAAIGEVHVLAWQAAYRGVMPDEYLDGLSADERAAMWLPRLGRDDLPPMLVAEADGRVVGFAVFGAERPAAECPEVSGRGELYAVNLHPAYWGRGIGRAVLREVMRRLAALGHAEAVLWVVPENTRARTLYEQEGWHADGAAQSDTMMGVTVAEVRHICRLPGPTPMGT